MSKSSKSVKFAQGLSLNTMIIGVIVLVVLMVLVGAFGGFFGNRFSPGFAEATEKKCELPDYEAKGECDGLTEQEVFGNFGENFPMGEKCCKKIAVLCEEHSSDLYCLDICRPGDSPYDKTMDGLDVVCDSPGITCCLSGSI